MESMSNYGLFPQIFLPFQRAQLSRYLFPHNSWFLSTLKRSVIHPHESSAAPPQFNVASPFLLLDQIPIIALTPKTMEDATVTESNEWEKLQTPADRTREWEMVVVRDNRNNHLQSDLSVLPSSNRDDRQVPPPPQSSPPVSPKHSGPSSDNFTRDEEGGETISSDSRQTAGNGISKLLGSMIVWIGGRARYYVTCRTGFCSFASVTVVVGVVLLYRRVQRWRQWFKAENNRLILTIKEKDQKINELFDQVGQLKKMLSARRQVPVIHVR